MESVSLGSMNVLDKIRFKENALSFSLSQIVWSSLFIAFCAQVKIPLPFTVVPISLQSLAVMLVGGMLGSRNGAMAVLFYLGEINLGLPVMAGGLSNSFGLIGPTGGYLIGFVFQAYITGWFSERKQFFGKSTLMLGLLLGYLIDLLFGGIWLGKFIGFDNVLWMGVVPFVPGDLLKMFIVANFLMRNQKEI